MEAVASCKRWYVFRLYGSTVLTQGYTCLNPEDIYMFNLFKCLLILSFHLFLDFFSSVFLSGFPINIHKAFLALFVQAKPSSLTNQFCFITQGV